MTRERAIEILDRRTSIPKEGETFEEISEAFDMGILALKKMEQISSIINFPFNVQEDIFKYKAICEAMKDFC